MNDNDHLAAALLDADVHVNLRHVHQGKASPAAQGGIVTSVSQLMMNETGQASVLTKLHSHCNCNHPPLQNHVSFMDPAKAWAMQTQVLLPVCTLNEEITAVTDSCELIDYGCVSFRWSGHCVSLRDSNLTLAGPFFKSDYTFQKTLIEADCLKSFEAAFPGTLGARRPCRITQIPFAAPCPQFHLSSRQ